MSKHIVGIKVGDWAVGGHWKAFCSCGWTPSTKFSATVAQNKVLYHWRKNV